MLACGTSIPAALQDGLPSGPQPSPIGWKSGAHRRFVVLRALHCAPFFLFCRGKEALVVSHHRNYPYPDRGSARSLRHPGLVFYLWTVPMWNCSLCYLSGSSHPAHPDLYFFSQAVLSETLHPGLHQSKARTYIGCFNEWIDNVVGQCSSSLWATQRLFTGQDQIHLPCFSKMATK